MFVRCKQTPRRLKRSTKGGLCAIALAAGAVLFAPTISAADSVGYPVKAAYLAKLGIFVEWPKSAFETPQSPVVLCIAGTDPFGDVLDKIVAGQRVGARAIVVKRMKTVTRQSGCAILFAGGSDEQSVDQALDAVNGAAVLTVTDNADGHETGIVDFVIQDGRVRFTIDDRAAEQNGITVSSHLLDLALAVKPRT
jgi:hypothetical protein